MPQWLANPTAAASGLAAGSLEPEPALILIRDAVYQATSKETRARDHESFGLALEARAGERLPEYEEIVGYHLEQAWRYRFELGVADERDAALRAQAAERLSSAGRRAFAETTCRRQRACSIAPSIWWMRRIRAFRGGLAARRRPVRHGRTRAGGGGHRAGPRDSPPAGGRGILVAASDRAG